MSLTDFEELLPQLASCPDKTDVDLSPLSTLFSLMPPCLKTMHVPSYFPRLAYELKYLSCKVDAAHSRYDPRMIFLLSSGKIKEFTYVLVKKIDIVTAHDSQHPRIIGKTKGLNLHFYTSLS